MTGTTVQPSREPPHEWKGTGTRHAENVSGEKKTKPRGRKWGKKMADRTQHKGKLNALANESHDRCSQLLGMGMPKTADLRHLRCS